MANKAFGSVRAVANGDVPWLPALIERARSVDGQPPFSDGSLVELATGQRTVLAIAESAIALVALPEAEFVVTPDARRRGLGTAMLEALIEQSDSHRASDSGSGSGDGALLVWSHGDHPGARALAASHGFTAVRTLLHLRADGADSDAGAGSGSDNDSGSDNGSDSGSGSTRPPLPAATINSFRPGVDDAEWLALNALVFAEHPEQGSLTQTDLDVILAEPWFEADDFLLLRDSASILIGYCWLKVEGSDGEFYVVGVHPDRHSQGLGRVLVEAGLKRLRGRGIRSAHLYVEAENLAAVHLYRSYGFVDDTIDVQYARTLPAHR